MVQFHEPNHLHPFEQSLHKSRNFKCCSQSTYKNVSTRKRNLNQNVFAYALARTDFKLQQLKRCCLALPCPSTKTVRCPIVQHTKFKRTQCSPNTARDQAKNWQPFAFFGKLPVISKPNINQRETNDGKELWVNIDERGSSRILLLSECVTCTGQPISDACLKVCTQKKRENWQFSLKIQSQNVLLGHNRILLAKKIFISRRMIASSASAM